MKKILILGAGLVARPLVRYLLDQPDFQVEVASRTVKKAEKLIENHPRGIAKELNLNNESKLQRLHQKSRETAIKKFNIEFTAQEYIKLYDRMIKSG